MRTQTMLNLSHRFWRIAAATLAWWGLSGGVLSLIVGTYRGGIINTLIGIGSLAVAFNDRALRWLEARPVNRYLAWLMLLWYGLLPIMLLGFISTTSSTLGFQLPYMVAREVVLLVLVVLAFREFALSIRSRG